MIFQHEFLLLLIFICFEEAYVLVFFVKSRESKAFSFSFSFYFYFSGSNHVNENVNEEVKFFSLFVFYFFWRCIGQLMIISLRRWKKKIAVC